MVKAKCSVCGYKYKETWSNKFILGWLGGGMCLCPHCSLLYSKKKEVKN